MLSSSNKLRIGGGVEIDKEVRGSFMMGFAAKVMAIGVRLTIGVGIGSRFEALRTT